MSNFEDIVANYTEADEITDASTFKKDLSLSSFDIVCISSDVKDEMGLDLTPNDFVEYNTVGKMKEYIKTL